MTEPVDWYPSASCEGKIQFADRVIAERASKRSRAKHQQPIAPYKCQHCGYWHLGQHPAGKSFNNRAKNARKTQGDPQWKTGRYR